MKKALRVILLPGVFFLLSACKNEAVEVNSDKEAADSVTVAAAIEQKRSELDLSDAPYGVTRVYSGTMFDYNNDGTEDYTAAYSLYMQFDFVVFDGETAEILLEERVMTPFDLADITTEIYADADDRYAVKNTGRTIYTVSSALTETIQITTASDTFIFEAVYDENTGELVHTYDKYTYDEYLQKQNECLDGYELYLHIEWNDYRGQMTVNS